MGKPSSRKTPSQPSARGPLRPGARAILLVVMAAFLVYFGAWNLGFTNYDDPEYVTENAMVLRGLSTDGVAWALRTGHAANWHPLTWLSHMLDVSMFGVTPGGHHVVNLLLHAVASVLLLWVLVAATGARGRALLVAMLFAVHPLQVETVAWISSRKGLLSAVLALAAMLAYVQNARQPSRARWIAVHVLFALGLMAKPMLVTWPFVLLLVDRWPLQRDRAWRHLVAEKVGLFTLAAAASVITFLVQRSGGAVAGLMVIPFADRAVNALVSYARYVQLLVWPSSLAAPYPHPYLSAAWGHWSAVAAVGSATGLAILAMATLWLTRTGRRPWWRVGLLWFFGMMVPVIGLVHVGNQAMADRYVYLPGIGIFVAAVWWLGELASRWRVPPRWSAALATVVVAAYGWTAHAQMKVWTDSGTLFEHATRHTRDNWLAWNNLGMAYRAQGRHDDALQAYDRSIGIRPDYADAHFNRGNALMERQRFGEAEASLRRALELAPARPDVLMNLGLCLLQQGRAQEALPLAERAVELHPDDLPARINLAATLLANGDAAQALRVVTDALEANPTAPVEMRRRLLEMRSYLEALPRGGG